MLTWHKFEDEITVKRGLQSSRTSWMLKTLHSSTPLLLLCSVVLAMLLVLITCKVLRYILPLSSLNRWVGDNIAPTGKWFSQSQHDVIFALFTHRQYKRMGQAQETKTCFVVIRLHHVVVSKLYRGFSGFNQVLLGLYLQSKLLAVKLVINPCFWKEMLLLSFSMSFFQSRKHHTWNSIHFHCFGVAPQISKPVQMKPKLSEWLDASWGTGWLTKSQHFHKLLNIHVFELKRSVMD